MQRCENVYQTNSPMFQFYICSACYLASPSTRVYPKVFLEPCSVEESVKNGVDGYLPIGQEKVPFPDIAGLIGLATNNLWSKQNIINGFLALISTQVGGQFAYINSAETAFQKVNIPKYQHKIHQHCTCQIFQVRADLGIAEGQQIPATSLDKWAQANKDMVKHFGRKTVVFHPVYLEASNSWALIVSAHILQLIQFIYATLPVNTVTTATVPPTHIAYICDMKVQKWCQQSLRFIIPFLAAVLNSVSVY